MCGQCFSLFKKITMLYKISLAFVYVMGLAFLLAIYAQDSPEDYLEVHNEARADVGASPMTWNSTIAAYAKNYGKQGVGDCNGQYSGGPYGENVANWSNSDLSGRDIIKMWVAEKKDYGSNYTQIIWQDSHSLGCYKVRCNNGGYFMSCNYFPPGNILGQRPNESTASSSENARPQDYLYAHNKARAEVGVGPLIWNDTLAIYAQNRVESNVADCNMVTIWPWKPVYGENVALSKTDISATQAVEMWTHEKSYYDFDSSSCRRGYVCNEYTQVVWQDSHHLGCAKVRCYTGIYLVSCSYYPPGNINGEHPIKSNKSAPTHEAISPNSASVPVPPFVSSKEGKKKIRLIAGLTAGSCVIIGGIVFMWLLLRWKRKPHENDIVSDVSFDDEFQNEMGPRRLSYSELASATNNFAEEGKLGEGGFGAVYKGFLGDMNTFIAVKKISGRSKQGNKEYTTEVNIISRLSYRNTVKLIGWCHEKESLMLVYEFMPNGSLDSHLFKGKRLLKWELRYKIIQDLASALLYLHEEGDDCVIHRDIKSSNIMLDSDFSGKLGDFGLARLVDHAKGSQTTALAGTLGYMAPECLTTSKASKESDIFCFGVVVLEIACGRRSIEHKYEEDQVSLVPWVWESYGNKRLLDVADKKLGTNFDTNQMEYVLTVGLWCAHPNRNLRPSVKQVIQVLNFELPLPNLPSKMPVAKYERPAVATVSSGSEPSQSLTIPR